MKEFSKFTILKDVKTVASNETIIMKERNPPKIRGARSIINLTQLSLTVGKSQNYFETLNKYKSETHRKFILMDYYIRKIIDLWK